MSHLNTEVDSRYELATQTVMVRGFLPQVSTPIPSNKAVSSQSHLIRLYLALSLLGS